MTTFNDLSGKTFGRWTVIKRFINLKNKKQTFYICKCSCGNEKIIQAGNLCSGKTKSCGCYFKEQLSKRRKSHGMSETRVYKIWCGMKVRCNSKTYHAYPYYGGRGISVCDRWNNSFENFFKDMGNPPTNFHTIERINNNGNYEPSNCKWATRKEQNKNKRECKLNHRNRIIIYKGESHTITQWSKILKIDDSTFFKRIKKWDIERAFTEPVRSNINPS